MALNSAQQDIISKGGRAAGALLDLYETMQEIDLFMVGVPNLQGTPTQEDLDAVPGFNGITLQQVLDNGAAISAIKNQITAAFTQLAIGKNLLGG